LQRHPDKTFIGRISRGFEFLGYAFSSSGLRIARKAVIRFAGRINRLYEYGAGAVRFGEYAQRWWRWVRAGVQLRGSGKVGEGSLSGLSQSDHNSSYGCHVISFEIYMPVSRMKTGPLYICLFRLIGGDVCL